MFRNQYDNDVTTWSPQGRIHQIEYAMEAVKQGSATVGLKSKTHAVIVALKRAQSELIGHQQKIEKISPHVLMSIAGLTSDARSLGKYMRSECLNHDFVYSCKLPVKRLVGNIGDKLQIPTQRYGRRPFGVGMLIAGCDEQGPHIFQTCPSANVYVCKAMALGARSQSAKTYLERNIESIINSPIDELVRHGLIALRETLPSEQKLSVKNCSIGIVSCDENSKLLDDKQVAEYLDILEKTAGQPTVAHGDSMVAPAVSGMAIDEVDAADDEEPMET